VHILFLSDNFPPEVNAPASRTFEHCREWVLLGHQVTVITCTPNFPRGRVYDGYRNRLWASEYIEGIRVIRVWSYIAANEGFFKRTLDYMSYMFSAICAAPFVSKVDLIVGTSPQFFTACAARVVSAYKRVPWVFELRDIWPESIRAVGAMKESRILDALEKLELYLYRTADAIVTVTHSFKSSLITRGVEASKIHVITNGVDIERFSPQEKDTQLEALYSLSGKFVVGYIGTHGLAHALDTILDCAASFKNSSTEENAFVFLFIGDGSEKARLIERQKLDNLDNVIFIESVSKNEVTRYWSLLDCSVIHLRKSELFKTVIPSKLFESMGMGVPVLHGVAGESARIVEDEGVGLVFESENSSDLRLKLEKFSSDVLLFESLKTNCLISAKNYDRKVLANNMCTVLNQIPCD
jgi:glycosyltransferase involved in cell wall biosynthesis